MSWGERLSQSPKSKTLRYGLRPGVPISGAPRAAQVSVGSGGALGSNPDGAGRGGLGSRGSGARGAGSGTRWAAAPSHTWPPTPVAMGPSEPRRPPSLAPLRSRRTKALTENREGAHAAGIPPGTRTGVRGVLTLDPPSEPPRSSRSVATSPDTRWRVVGRERASRWSAHRAPLQSRRWGLPGAPRPASPPRPPPGQCVRAARSRPQPARAAHAQQRAGNARCPARPGEGSVCRVLRTVESLVHPRALDWVPPKPRRDGHDTRQGRPGIPASDCVHNSPGELTCVCRAPPGTGVMPQAERALKRTGTRSWGTTDGHCQFRTYCLIQLPAGGILPASELCP